MVLQQKQCDFCISLHKVKPVQPNVNNTSNLLLLTGATLCYPQQKKKKKPCLEISDKYWCNWTSKSLNEQRMDLNVINIFTTFTIWMLQTACVYVVEPGYKFSKTLSVQGPSWIDLIYSAPNSAISFTTLRVNKLDLFHWLADSTAAPIKWRNANITCLSLPLTICNNGALISVKKRENTAISLHRCP